MHIRQHTFAIIDARIGLAYIGFATANRLDFCALQRYARLIGVDDMVVVTCSSVIDENLNSLFP